jgi:hypothetical protein
MAGVVDVPSIERRLAEVEGRIEALQAKRAATPREGRKASRIHVQEIITVTGEAPYFLPAQGGCHHGVNYIKWVCRTGRWWLAGGFGGSEGGMPGGDPGSSDRAHRGRGMPSSTSWMI